MSVYMYHVPTRSLSLSLSLSLSRTHTHTRWEYQLDASFLEIYNESVRDLLCPASELEGTNTNRCLACVSYMYTSDALRDF